MDEAQADAFIYWFSSKYQLEQLGGAGSNAWAYTQLLDGRKVSTYLTFVHGMWQVACPVFVFDRRSAKNAFDVMKQKTEVSPFGFTLIGDMLCVVNCLLGSSPLEADEWIQNFGLHALALQSGH